MKIDEVKLFGFLKEFIIVDDDEKSNYPRTITDDLIDGLYSWGDAPIDLKTCSDIAADLGFDIANKSIVTSIGASLRKRGLSQTKRNGQRVYCIPPVANHERRANSYKQECINAKSDLCGLQTLICEARDSHYIEEQTSRDLLNKIRAMIDGINEIFARIERSD